MVVGYAGELRISFRELSERNATMVGVLSSNVKRQHTANSNFSSSIGSQ
jgi:hypothetical protein